MQIHGPFDLVLFGGLGDLARRKLLPALYMLDLDERLPAGHIVWISRQSLEGEQRREQLRIQVQPHLPASVFDAKCWQRFSNRIRLYTLDVADQNAYEGLAKQLSGGDNRVFYLATGSNLYTDICQGLDTAKLITEHSKVVLEKPIGHDFSSAQAINEAVADFFQEVQIYRIDHYLGNDTVQNLMVL